jgi:hypothetical protein
MRESAISGFFSADKATALLFAALQVKQLL